MRDIRNYRGSLDFAEFVIDPANKNTTPRELGAAIADYIEILGGWNNADWNEFRDEILYELKLKRLEQS